MAGMSGGPEGCRIYLITQDALLIDLGYQSC